MTDHEDLELTPLQSMALWVLIAILMSWFAGISAALLYVGWVQFF